MGRWTVSSDTRKAERKYRSLLRKLETEGSLALQDVGELGRSFARSIAPYDTGVVYKNIQYKVSNTERTMEIVAVDPFGKAPEGMSVTRYPGKGVRKFQLIRYMHANPGEFRGDGKFMYTTRQFVAGIAPGKVRGSFRRVVAEINNT